MLHAPTYSAKKTKPMETPRASQQPQVREPKTQKEVAGRPPLPPFTRETAIQKVRLAEDGWNSRDPEKVALAYTIDSRWRNRAKFPSGRQEIIQFLKRKWAKELDYRLIKELWAYTGNRIAVRSPTNGTMTRGIGSAHMEMRTGSSTIMA
jgi:hypothetical protein